MKPRTRNLVGAAGRDDGDRVVCAVRPCSAKGDRQADPQHLTITTDQDVGARADSERKARRSGPIMTGQRVFAEISGWRDHRPQYDGRREIADIGVELGQRTGGL